MGPRGWQLWSRKVRVSVKIRVGLGGGGVGLVRVRGRHPHRPPVAAEVDAIPAQHLGRDVLGRTAPSR